ncbi:MAG: hypothetical protein CSB34_05310 [Desulfobulbus propionicus]|nr:MAG: hypothetical protein CSB34_05310 [Desulfobulbus propionicus]
MTRLRIPVILLGITILGYGGVTMFYDQVQEQLAAMIPQTSTSAGKQQARRPQPKQVGDTSQEVDGSAGYQIIVQRNIFQAVIEAPAAAPEDQVKEELEETTLKLVLLGTVVGTKEDARAIIVDEKKKKQDLYRIGDLIQNARVEKISRGKVTLNVNGKIEALTIKDRKGGGPGPPVVAAKKRSPQQKKSLSTTSKRKVPVVKPRRRISFRANKPTVSEKVQGATEPLPIDVDELEKMLEEMDEEGNQADQADPAEQEQEEGEGVEGYE